MTQIFLLAVTGDPLNTWPDPGNWNPTNMVECIGAGGGANPGNLANGQSGSPGGAYAVGNNIMPAWPASYIAKQATLSTYNYYGTNFNSTTIGTDTTVGCVSAQCGNRSGSGGPVAGPTTVFPSGRRGGSSGSATGQSGGAGGGGAGGPHGNGGNGANSVGTTPGGGGAADAGTVPGQPTASAPGNSGTEWDATHGCGGGGAGSAAVGTPSGTGGNFGGGAGGWFEGETTPTTLSGDGLIIITYTPYVPPTAINVALVA